MRRIKPYLPLLVLVLVVVAVFASGVTRYLNFEALQTHEAALRAFVGDNLIVALITFIGIYAVATAVSLPGALILTLTGGYLFGPWVGGSATVVGATLGAVAVFYAVRTSLGAAMRRRAEASAIASSVEFELEPAAAAAPGESRSAASTRERRWRLPPAFCAAVAEPSDRRRSSGSR